MLATPNPAPATSAQSLRRLGCPPFTRRLACPRHNAHLFDLRKQSRATTPRCPRATSRPDDQLLCYKCRLSRRAAGSCVSRARLTSPARAMTSTLNALDEAVHLTAPPPDVDADVEPWQRAKPRARRAHRGDRARAEQRVRSSRRRVSSSPRCGSATGSVPRLKRLIERSVKLCSARATTAAALRACCMLARLSSRTPRRDDPAARHRQALGRRAASPAGAPSSPTTTTRPRRRARVIT